MPNTFVVTTREHNRVVGIYKWLTEMTLIWHIKQLMSDRGFYVHRDNTDKFIPYHEIVSVELIEE